MLLRFRTIFPVLLAYMLSCGCAKQVHLDPQRLAQSGVADARIELNYNRNDAITLKLSHAPAPESINPAGTCYVLWVATPDRRYVINVGRIRVEKGKAQITTSTPLHRFVLLITAETSGEVMTPSHDLLFESKEIIW
jgi:hypothetical protein